MRVPCAVLLITLSSLAGCSRTSAKLDPCNLSGMKDASDKVVEVPGVGESAAAGFSFSEGDTLKLFAAESKGHMVGIRPRAPIKENDEKFNRVKVLAASALGRMK